jgi:hypothetical protein
LVFTNVDGIIVIVIIIVVIIGTGITARDGSIVHIINVGVSNIIRIVINTICIIIIVIVGTNFDEASPVLESENTEVSFVSDVITLVGFFIGPAGHVLLVTKIKIECSTVNIAVTNVGTFLDGSYLTFVGHSLVEIIISVSGTLSNVVGHLPSSWRE